MNPRNNLKPIVLWVVWASMFAAIFFYQNFLAGGFPTGKDMGNPNYPIIFLAIGVVTVATIIRWLVIPKLHSPQRILPFMIAGLALAESAQFYQIFLIGPNYPQTQLAIFFLSAVGIAQFAPFYAHTDPKSESRI